MEEKNVKLGMREGKRKEDGYGRSLEKGYKYIHNKLYEIPKN